MSVHTPYTRHVMNLSLLFHYVSTKRLHDFWLCQTAHDKLSNATAL